MMKKGALHHSLGALFFRVTGSPPRIVAPCTTPCTQRGRHDRHEHDAPSRRCSRSRRSDARPWCSPPQPLPGSCVHTARRRPQRQPPRGVTNPLRRRRRWSCSPGGEQCRRHRCEPPLTWLHPPSWPVPHEQRRLGYCLARAGVVPARVAAAWECSSAVRLARRARKPLARAWTLAPRRRVVATPVCPVREDRRSASPEKRHGMR
jgi:hypothetical protein